MSAASLRESLDQLNSDCVALDQRITKDRAKLAELNKQRGDLETEFQRVNAAEEQAALKDAPQ